MSGKGAILFQTAPGVSKINIGYKPEYISSEPRLSAKQILFGLITHILWFDGCLPWYYIWNIQNVP